MSSRFVPVALFRGHWKGLSDYRHDSPVADRLTRLLIVALPLSAAAAIWVFGGRLTSPGALLSGVALLTGGFLAAFGQISTLRLRLTDRRADYEMVEQIDRDALDETAAHLLMASFMSALTALTLVLGMNFALCADGTLKGFWAAAAVALSSYVLLIFMIAIPRLYVAYVNINSVRAELSGTHRD